MPVLQRRPKRDFSDDTLKAIQTFVIRRTSGMISGGLRTDLRQNLTDDEQAELVGLTREAEGDDRSFVLDRLSKRKQQRWETLVGKGGGNPKFFADYRDAEQIKEIAAQAHVGIVRRPFLRREESGLLDALAEQVIPDKPGRPHLYLDRAGVLLGVLLMFSSGKTFSPRSRVERDEDGQQVLIFDQTYGLFGDCDPRSAFGNWPKTLQRLEATGWLVLGGGGPAREIRLGPRALRALGDLPPSKRRAAA